MRKILATRFVCDFCNYSRSDSKSVEKHEKACFKNPKRVCYCGVTAEANSEDFTKDCRACSSYSDYLRRKEGDYD